MIAAIALFLLRCVCAGAIAAAAWPLEGWRFATVCIAAIAYSELTTWWNRLKERR